MLRIRALNQSASDSDTSDEAAQVESKEAQEAHLFSQYNSALVHIAEGKYREAEKLLLSIVESSCFINEANNEAITKTLKYNVYKNLGECHLHVGSYTEAQEELLAAADIDGTDVTLWFKIAGTAVKLDNLFLCRSALEQGLHRSPTHQLCLENLVTATYKLGDYIACIGYSNSLTENDPGNTIAITFKSKIYKEMPFLQDMFDDSSFVSVPTTIDVINQPPQEPTERDSIHFELKEMTFVSFGKKLLDFHALCEKEDRVLNPVNTNEIVQQYRKLSPSKVIVKIMNEVEEIVDIMESREDVVEYMEILLDGVISDMFGVEPISTSEKAVMSILTELVSSAVEMTENETVKRKSVNVPIYGDRRKANYYNIPEDCIEKRRSSRKPRPYVESTHNSDASNDCSTIQTPRELIRSFLPDELKCSDRLLRKLNCGDLNKKGGTGAEVPNPAFSSNTKWFGKEEEEATLVKFLQANNGLTVWHLMRSFLEMLSSLESKMNWPDGLAAIAGQLYSELRLHLTQDPISVMDPRDSFKFELLNCMLIGNECILSCYLLEAKNSKKGVLLPQEVRHSVEKDLLDLKNLISALEAKDILRIFGLSFNYQCILGNIEEALWEGEQIREMYVDGSDLAAASPVQNYAIPTLSYINDYINYLERNRELEELSKYYANQDFGAIVRLLKSDFEDRFGLGNLSEALQESSFENELDMLIESLFYLGTYSDCCRWCIFSLLCHFSKIDSRKAEGQATFNENDWIILEAYLTMIEDCLEQAGQDIFQSLPRIYMTNFADLLTRIISVQIELPVQACFSSVRSWMLLHQIIAWSEDRKDSDGVQAEMPGSLNLLCSAHDYLGQKSCCTAEQGKLLKYLVETFVNKYLSPIKPVYHDRLKRYIDQAVFCLFSHPSKKSRARHLADHGVSQIALDLKFATLIYSYLKPDKIAEYDDPKPLTISSEMEIFLRRVVAVLPLDIQIEKRKERVKLFLTGKASKIKTKSLDHMSSGLEDLFYMLADYHFKGGELDKAIEFYCLDVSFNVKRFDSWAGLALAQASMCEQKLNSCKTLVPSQILDQITAVKTCFQTCMELDESNAKLWIEYGNFSYIAHSFISRTIQTSTDVLDVNLFEDLENKKEQFLKQAEMSYQKTLTLFEEEGIGENEIDERWLIFYMKGKIYEKKNLSIRECIDMYLTSVKFLSKNQIILPKKINYGNPPALALESLELYYRIHASILKYLSKHEKDLSKVSEDTLRFFFDAMKKVQLDPIYSQNSGEDRSQRFRPKRKASDDIDPLGPCQKTAKTEVSHAAAENDKIEIVQTVDKKETEDAEWTSFTLEKMEEIAVCGLEDVIAYFSHHFKAFYRLAAFFSTSHVASNKEKAKYYLLGNTGQKTNALGLFSGRKPNQVFHEVWRIPIPEIDRAGSFAAHCSKMLTLLLDCLKSVPDIMSLADITLQLRKPPNEENKFLIDKDRVEFATISSTYLLNGIKSLIKQSEVWTPTWNQDIYKIYQRFQKQWPGKEKEILACMKIVFLRAHNRGEQEKATNDETLRYFNQEGARNRSTASSRLQAAMLKSSAMNAANEARSAISSDSNLGSATEVKVPPFKPMEKHEVVSAVNKIVHHQQLAASNAGLSANVVALMSNINLDAQMAELTKIVLSLQAIRPSDLASIKITSADLKHVLAFGQDSSVPAVKDVLNKLINRQTKFENKLVKDIMMNVKKAQAVKKKPNVAGSSQLGSPGVSEANAISSGPSGLSIKKTQTTKELKKTQALKMALKQTSGVTVTTVSKPNLNSLGAKKSSKPFDLGSPSSSLVSGTNVSSSFRVNDFGEKSHLVTELKTSAPSKVSFNANKITFSQLKPQKTTLKATTSLTTPKSVKQILSIKPKTMKAVGKSGVQQQRVVIPKAKTSIQKPESKGSGSANGGKDEEPEIICID